MAAQRLQRRNLHFLRSDGRGWLYLRDRAGKSIKPQRQLYEEIITVAAGRGATSVWYDGTAKRTFEWERGSTFAIPLNAWHQHHNASGTEPCRYFALTSQPVAFELYRDPEFIYNTNYQFKDRFDPGDAGVLFQGRKIFH